MTLFVRGNSSSTVVGRADVDVPLAQFEKFRRTTWREQSSFALGRATGDTPPPKHLRAPVHFMACHMGTVSLRSQRSFGRHSFALTLSGGLPPEARKREGWRMGWDSNPRGALTPAGFQDRSLQPLGHPSGLVGRNVGVSGRAVNGRAHGRMCRPRPETVRST